MPIEPKRLPFFEHIAELRKRLVILIVTISVGSMILYVQPVYNYILTWLFKPISQFVKPGDLKVFGPFESFTYRFKVSLFAAIVVFSPIIIWQILAFFLPALKPNERKWAIPTFAAAVILFVGGAAFAYGVIMYPAFQFMYAQAGSMVQILPSADKFLSGIMLLLVGFGLAFEVPIVVFYSVGFGLIKYKKLRENWRFVYTALAIVAAVATPDWSPITMGALGAALAILYESSLLLARFSFAKRIREQAEELAELEW